MSDDYKKGFIDGTLAERGRLLDALQKLGVSPAILAVVKGVDVE